jgi:hypothetical protein
MTKSERLRNSIKNRFNVELPLKLVNALFRAEKSIGRFDELLCGSSEYIGASRYDVSIRPTNDDYTEFEFIRQGQTGKIVCRHPIADSRIRTLKRLSAVLATFGLAPFHQSDPRGCSLYVAPIGSRDVGYSNGVACC